MLLEAVRMAGIRWLDLEIKLYTLTAVKPLSSPVLVQYE